jgi:hypothetical protein
MNAYFELGGHVIETYVTNESTPGRPPMVTARELSKQHQVPQSMIRAVDRKAKADTGVSPLTVLDSYSRLRRARWALTTAAALAAADGPLPFGDAIAIGVLGVYTAYEVKTSVTQLM